jgi:FkbM family methyltransferase
MTLSSQTLRHALVLFSENPLMAFRKAAVRLLPDPSGTRILKLNGVAFPCDFSFDPAVKEMYYGTYEQQIVGLLHEFLKDGDLFLDVGANIGYLTAVASGLVGPRGAVHSFEPVPRYVERLRMLQPLNPGRAMHINQCALGDQAGTARIDVTNLPNIGWNTMVPNYMPAETRSATVEVPVRRLDDYLLEHTITAIGLIKIDTEGYELPVLKGMTAYFQNASGRPPIICEIAPAAYPLLGTSLAELEALMKGFGYRSYSADRHRSPLPLTSVQDTTNVLFLPVRQ